MSPIRNLSTGLVLVVLFLCWIIIRIDVAPAAVNDNPVDSTFHVSNSIGYLQHIAREPHSLGTTANDRVRNYIDSACRGLGLEVREMPFTFTHPEYKGLVVARGINIAATLRGTQPATFPGTQRASSVGKKILVMAHYDSEPNALGAGDDGSACAAMLESARALRASAPLSNDVLFLFTNGEEDGLLGAEAFASDRTQLTDIGMVINFDGRGDEGKCLMFRTSPDNDWVVREFARSDIHHGAGSVYSELFKLLPNNTDYSPLQNTGIPGLDFAFAEGFVHYHNLTDNVANIDRRMMQEQGDNMLGSIRHFGRLDLHHPVNSLVSNTTYFNLVGDILIRYSSFTNFIFVILANILVLLALFVGLRRKSIRLVHAALGLLIFPLTLAVLYFLAGWTLDAVRSAWPLYSGYYPNAYNGYYFYLTLAAEALGVFTLVYQWPMRKWSTPSLFIAILVCLTVLMDVLYQYIPAGVYFLYFPLIGSALLAAFLPQRYLPRLLATLPAILWLAPLIYSLAEVFDTEPQAAMVAPVTGLLLGLLIPVFSPSLRHNRWLIPAGAAFVLLLSAGLGVLHGGYSHDKPLKTDIRYVAQPDSRQAWWVSRTGKPDRWNKTLLTQPSLRPNSYPYTLAAPAGAREWFSPAPWLDLPAPTLSVTGDSIVSGHRRLSLHCQAASGTTTFHINFTTQEPADSISIAGANFSGPIGWLEYHAPPDDGFDFTLTCKPATPFSITVTDRRMGIPAGAGFHGYPDDVIPTPAFVANTTMVQRSYTFN
jgi:hypothetical protein